MRTRLWSVVAAGALISSVFTAGSAHAAPEIPATVNIEDAKGDSNGLNDQGDGALLGDNSGGVTVGSADILKVWFTTTDKLNVHILTSLPAGGGSFGINYRVFFNGTCHAFQGNVGGKTNLDAAPKAIIRDLCDTAAVPVEGEIVVETLEDTTGLTTMSFPLGAWPGVETGATLAGPSARTRLIAIDRTAPQMDTTAVGTDYAISSGGTPSGPPVVQEPPVDKPDPKGCKKGKGKKKGCGTDKGNGPKPQPAPGCAAYTPGEEGAEAETLVVTPDASAEKPVEHEIVMDMAVGLLTGELPVVGVDNPATSETAINIQVDSNAPTSGLYVRFEFPEDEDYDLYLNNADGSEAARVGGFNQVPDVSDGTGNGGHSEAGAEMLDGILTNDCGGYTLQIKNAFGLGEGTLKLWTGPATWDPASQSAIPAKAFIF